jgi:hypothetical protein
VWKRGSKGGGQSIVRSLSFSAKSDNTKQTLTHVGRQEEGAEEVGGYVRDRGGALVRLVGQEGGRLLVHSCSSLSAEPLSLFVIVRENTTTMWTIDDETHEF